MSREETLDSKIQASFEVIGDDVKFVKLIVNGKEKVVSVEELENTPSETYRETDDYENEIADLHNRLDIAEYDKERLREEVTILEEKLKALYTEPCDCISREEVCDYIAEFVNHEYATDRERELVKHIIGGIQHLPSIQPTAKENLVVEDCISRAELIGKTIKRNSIWLKITDSRGMNLQEIIDELPSIQPKTGHWIYGVCSECGWDAGQEAFSEDANFCMKCGAKMLPTDAEKEWQPQYEGEWVAEKE